MTEGARRDQCVFRCRTCGRRTTLDSSYARQMRVKCPSCGGVLAIMPPSGPIAPTRAGDLPSETTGDSPSTFSMKKALPYVAASSAALLVLLLLLLLLLGRNRPRSGDGAGRDTGMDGNVAAIDVGQGGEDDEVGTGPPPPEPTGAPGADGDLDPTTGGSEADDADETGDASGDPHGGGDDAGDDEGDPSGGTDGPGRGEPPPGRIFEENVAPVASEEDETSEEEDDVGDVDEAPGGDDDGDRSRFGGRKGEGKRKALKRGGGSKGSEAAVTLALQWLAKHQDKDGSWSPDQFMSHDPPNDRCTGPGGAGYRIGLSGLALLCFLGAGHGSAQGDYRNTVAGGVSYLLRVQNKDGGFGERPNMYQHAIATLALVEAVAIDGHLGSSSEDRRGIGAFVDKAASLRPGQDTFDAADRAVSFILKAQQDKGGWDYGLGRSGRNDMSITGWQVLALVGAESIGIKIPGDVKKKVSGFLDGVSPATGDVRYLFGGGGGSSALTASALLCRIYLVGKPNDEVYRLSDLVAAHPPSWGRMAAKDRRQNLYTWYYGAMGLFQVGGKRWTRWNSAMRPELVNNQQKKGSAAGSWDPAAQWARVGGRVYSTAMCCLCLEVYYRYGRKPNY